jgi:hypothetical protein
MNKCLILQILGNRDIKIPESDASQLNNCTNYNNVKEKSMNALEEYKADKTTIKLPLIEELKSKNSPEEEYSFCIILTDQTEWIRVHADDAHKQKIANSDGHWWKDILTSWSTENSMDIHLIDLKVSADVTNGAADWEGMAEQLHNILDREICLDDEQISVNKTIFNKIIIQHSSGTPALISALYLWGIEKKLAGVKIEFTYVSDKNGNSESTIHDGSHWQWRLKVPQINQLLEIQDFAGAHVLMKDEQHVNQEIKDDLDLLDRAISLNIKDSSAVSPKDKVIERISIALWSERAFRDRHQWTQWYMRIAGGLELALLCLVEHKGEGSYTWEKKNSQEENSPRIYLKHLSDSKDCSFSSASISNIVQQLLTRGQCDIKKDECNQYGVQKMDDFKWNEFRQFYCNSWISNRGFITLRNNLYHSLMGDDVDEILDTQTNHLGSVDHEKHPARIAVEYLNYIIDQAQIKSEVDIKVCEYQQKVEEIKEALS